MSRFGFYVAVPSRTMLPMYSAATILRVLFAAAMITVICGCRKASEPIDTPARNPSGTKSPGGAPEKSSQLARRVSQAVNRRLENLGDADKWRRMSLAGLRGAVEACDKELADPMTHIRAGDKALANGQTELSIDCFRRATQADRKNADAHRGLAMAIFALASGQDSLIESRRQYRRAAEVYQTILKLEPKDETARFNLALAMMRSGGSTQAAEMFQSLLTSEKFAARATFNMAVILSSHGKLTQAAVLLRQLIKSKNNMGPADLADAYSRLGEVLSDLDDRKGALEAYKEAASLTPNEVAGWLNLAAAARAQGSYGYAVTATRKAIKLSPFNAEIHLRLGNVLLELHRATLEDRFLEDAVAAWRESLKIDPSQTALRRRVDIYSRKAPKAQPPRASSDRL